jgi:hypothetical protein
MRETIAGDLGSINDAMGHSVLATTWRYLHARPAAEHAAALTLAFEVAPAPEQLIRAV